MCMDTRSQQPTADDRLIADTVGPKLYAEFASWWPLLSSPDDYIEEAAFYQRELVGACEHTPHTLLELGSGGGNNASHLKIP